MILLFSNQSSLLTPTKVCKYYNFFFHQYSLMTVSHLVSQGSLITANNNDKCFYDNQIDDFINSFSDIAKDETDLFKMCSLAVQIDQGALIQEKESRTFLVDLFKDEAKKQSISNRELVLRELNATAFLNYYTLLESSIKKCILMC